jgi:hypothetical protein
MREEFNMHHWFNIGDTFIFDGLKWEIVRIDFEDDEYPYECWPVDIIEKAKKMAENGGITNEYGGLLEFDDYEYVLIDYFVNKRMCCSDYDIKDYLHRQTIEENNKLKAEIKKLKGE